MDESMEKTSENTRILISYVSLKGDLCGSSVNDGPAVGIATQLVVNGMPPGKVFLIWETNYLRTNKKGDAEWRHLKESIHNVLPNAEVVKLPIDLTDEDASDFDKAFPTLATVFAKIINDSDDEVFVNVSSGTHAVQTILFLLAMRESNARIVHFVHDLERKEPRCLVTPVQNARKEFRQIEEREAEDKAEKASQEDATVEKDLAAKIINVAKYTLDPILLLGETGTGKTRCAELIAEGLGIPKQKFVAVNCATLGDIASSQLFGHVEGAFTGASKEHIGFIQEANDGLLFLDEIGTLELKVQGMLLKVLDNGKFRKVGAEVDEESHFVLVCGTNENLEANCAKELFRRDLYERIRTWTFPLKPVRERLNEIGDLVEEFLRDFNAEIHSSKRISTTAKVKISSTAKKFIREHIEKLDLTGNLRTIRGLVRRLATHALMEAAGLGKCEISMEQVKAEFKEMEKLKSEQTNHNGRKTTNGSTSTTNQTTVERDEIIDSIVREAMGEKYNNTPPIKRCQLNYVVKLVFDGIGDSEIEKMLFDYLDKERRPQALKKFFNRFGPGISLSRIRDDIGKHLAQKPDCNAYRDLNTTPRRGMAPSAQARQTLRMNLEKVPLGN